MNVTAFIDFRTTQRPRFVTGSVFGLHGHHLKIRSPDGFSPDRVELSRVEQTSNPVSD